VSEATYQVRIAGAVPAELLRELSDLTVTVEPPETVLYGWLPDQSALFGLIVRLHGFGLEVIEVRRLAGGEDPDEDPDEEPDEDREPDREPGQGREQDWPGR
jgi:hypothetical protein